MTVILLFFPFELVIFSHIHIRILPSNTVFLCFSSFFTKMLQKQPVTGCFFVVSKTPWITRPNDSTATSCGSSRESLELRHSVSQDFWINSPFVGIELIESPSENFPYRIGTPRLNVCCLGLGDGSLTHRQSYCWWKNRSRNVTKPGAGQAVGNGSRLAAQCALRAWCDLLLWMSCGPFEEGQTNISCVYIYIII